MAAVSNIRTGPFGPVTHKWGWHVEGNDICAECVCESMRDWLEILMSLGGDFVECDDVRRGLVGLKKMDGGTRVMLTKEAVREGCAEMRLPEQFMEMVRVPGGRKKLAWVLSVGDHCLEFEGPENWRLFW